MRNLIILVTAVVVQMLCLADGTAMVEESQTLRESFTLRNADEGRLVVVNNVWGYIKVTGQPGDEVEVVVRKTVRAHSEREFRNAIEEVALDITEEDGFLEFYVDGPFRGNRWRGGGGRKSYTADYGVYYEFDLRIPEDADIELRGVNDGAIEVRGISGDYRVRHVNDDIDMRDISGSGEVYTVNGDVTLHFGDNPKGDCRFGSLNGEVRMHFQPGLGADFHLKTFNGEFYTDFDVDYVPSLQFAEVESNGETVYRAGHTTVVRAGEGGPVIELDGFNGDMYILEDR